MERKISELNLKNNTFILGKRKEIKEILAITDLLVLTSYIEGFPNVMLEAMVSMVPCLATDVGEVKFIISDTGYIVEPGDVNNIKKKLNEFLNLSVEERNKLAEKAFVRVKYHFDINSVGKKLMNLYSF